MVVYLPSDPVPHHFRVCLRRHAELLRAFEPADPDRTKREVVDPYQRALSEERATLRHPVVANEMRVVLSAGGRHRVGQLRPSVAPPPRLRSTAFGALRWAWLMDGDRVADVATSSSLPEAIAREQGRSEGHELSRQYFHLAPLVDTA